MTATEFGAWEPLSLAETVRIFRGARFRWWVAGGRALELHLGRSWRDHDDTDVGVSRTEVPHLRSLLDGWDIHVAASGRLHQWQGEELRRELSQNNLWCRTQPDAPWALDVTISEGEREAWVYRRDPSVRLPWGDAVLRSVEGVPYLAPELQLLFKSKEPREKDEIDARHVIPALDEARRVRLRELLSRTHPWRALIVASEADESPRTDARS